MWRLFPARSLAGFSSTSSRCTHTAFIHVTTSSSSHNSIRSLSSAAPIPPVESAAKLTYKDVVAAYARISKHVTRTRLDRSARLSNLTGCNIYLKKEHVSITGSVCGFSKCCFGIASDSWMGFGMYFLLLT